MEFYIKIPKSTILPSSLKSAFSEKVDTLNGEVTFTITGRKDFQTVTEITQPYSQTWVLGDPVYHDNSQQSLQNQLLDGDFGNFIRNVDGFYFIVQWQSIGKLCVSSSLFGVLPVFYADLPDKLLISSSFDLIKNYSELSWTTDKQYYLEKALFNYPLFNRTPIREIKTVPPDAVVCYDGSLTFERHTDITAYFVERPKSWRKSLDHLSDLFISNAKDFLPRQRFCATLTGGLDGRTMVGMSLQHGLDFYTYSYGSKESLDVTIPIDIAKLFKIDHKPFLIDAAYSERHFWDYGTDFVKDTWGLGNIPRAHYSYVCEKIVNDVNYLVSGNFGSEILRSMKIPGVMTSEIMFNLFENHSRNNLRQKILDYPPVQYLSAKLVYELVDELLDEIFSYINSLPKHLTSNQKFYTYLYNGVFPKYFGAEITVQRQHFNHRSPFLCFRFMEELLKTEVAGANSDYRETNPMKRYRGQVLYSHIIRKTKPELLDLLLDKGYKPRNFLTPLGPAKIAAGYAMKKIFPVVKDKNTPSFATQNHERSLDKMLQMNYIDEIFNPQFIEKVLRENWRSDQMALMNTVSAAYYFNHLTGNL